MSFFPFFLIEQSYLGIYWTDFHDLFHQMEGICVNVVNPDQFFFDSSRALPWQPILCKIGELTFIQKVQHPGILK